MLDERKNGGSVDVLMIDVMRPGKRRNNKIRQTVASDIEVTHVERAASTSVPSCAYIVRVKHRLDPVRRNCLHRCDVIIEAAELVEAEEENRAFPRCAVH